MRGGVILITLALLGCGSSSHEAPEEGTIVITYTQNGQFTDDVMYVASTLLPTLSREVALIPSTVPRLHVELSKDGYTEGKAAVCELRGWVKITPMNLQGEDRFIHAVYAVLHELGHMLGATHGTGIMAPNVLYKAHTGPTWSEESIRQIEECLDA